MKHADRENNFDFLIRSIGLSMKATANKKLEAYGLTNPQGRLLGAIYNGIKENHDISRKALQETMRVSGPSVTSLLNSLEKNGFIKRLPNKEDARAFEIIVTTKGENLIDDMNKVFKESQERLVACLNIEEMKTFLALLQKVYRNLPPEE